MRAVRLTGFGGPEKLEYREDVPDPHAGPGEVRVRVAATAINNTDIWTREGAYGSAEDPGSSAGWRREPLSFPRIQGADVVGHVDEVGEGVPDSRIGERVVVDPMLYTGGERELVTTEYLGSERDGGFAEYVTVPAGNAHPVRSSLTDAELATFPTAYTTAMRMLNRAAVRDGERVVVTGASGGVGSALIQLAALRGAHVVAVTSAAKRQRALDLGAETTVDRASDDLAGEISAHGPVDVVADVVAGPHFSALLRVLGPLGRYVVAGAIAGPLVETDLRTVYLNQVQLIGSSFGTHEDFEQLLGHVAAGELKPLLAGTYPLRELNRAQKDFVGKDFFGKLVVIPGAETA
ncbi:NADPH:quinone reductase-like Zn-dependent oxidoreductase [Saccharopolyspora erythraea NRRL 2338]|uniref:Alcohol dehydrogenase, zinc-binding domain protein n=2 Tax=Saccharopolyspora erythraea TaxID=1836 RepID=A4FAZ1_SACEN|nr:alcohol dehydrogenase family protein [Saccharopolyspora erythraea]EQD87597.1 Zn-dependent oxidoreductase [Saccharopolyspora erythraea D]PFG95000.1 NADPH:quinone reductase-like Zn-dependent oxidoreductase [Saccharopolyspora erythraea NRRL 2338]QRK91689.1 alcohol dehydrogenase family protein [Saccharopolyspora erythraea]CAM01216.1 alcohol dehydrogenase, zinc-binding domain protein [Saccharopolyspora erythraea NRRL 2338]